MTEAGFALEGRQIRVRREQAARRALTGVLLWAVALGNAGLIVWLWAHGGNLTTSTTGEALTSVGRITGLLAAYSALLQVLLLARLPALERSSDSTGSPSGTAGTATPASTSSSRTWSSRSGATP